MADRETTYVPEDLEQAARESRAWSNLALAHAGIHDAMAGQLDGSRKRVAEVLAKVQRENAEHAARIAALYEQGAASCR